MENTEPEFRSLGVGAPECDVKKWKTRSLTLNMENTECDVKNMENTESDRRIVSVKYGKQ